MFVEASIFTGGFHTFGDSDEASVGEEVVDPDDIEMLEDLVAAAVNEALRKQEEASQQIMGSLAGGLGGLGGGFPF